MVMESKTDNVAFAIADEMLSRFRISKYCPQYIHASVGQRNPRHTTSTRLCHANQSQTMTGTPRLVVRPEGHLLMDENLEIMITGLAKQQKATLHAVIREGKAVFESCCCFSADDEGNVDLTSQPSLEGSYTGTFSTLSLRIAFFVA